MNINTLIRILRKALSYMVPTTLSSIPEQAPEEPVAYRTVDVVRLHVDQLAALSNKYPACIVTTQTTAEEVAYRLGIQRVLDDLRRGWTL